MIQFYKPNSKNEGCAVGFRRGVHNDRNPSPCVYMTAVKQYSWDSKNRSGSFSENAKNPDKNIQVKLSPTEMAGFIYAVERHKEFSAFHSFEDTNTSIAFKPYTKKANGAQAFSLTLTRNSAEKFGIGMEMSEAYLLANFFKYVLNKFFRYNEEQQEKNRSDSQ